MIAKKVLILGSLGNFLSENILTLLNKSIFIAVIIFRKVKVEVHNTRDIKKITNVIGTLKGSTEPGKF